MSLTLSSSDLADLSHAVRLLTAPLDHESTDHWRRAVNRHLKAMLGADSIGFVLPDPEALLGYTEEHDIEAFNQYPEWTPPPTRDGTPVFTRIREMGVSRIEDAYDGDLSAYLNSDYYHEYAGPNGACDTLTAVCPLPGAEPLDFAFVQLWHERWDRTVFGEREVALLQMLYPAFLAGIEAHRSWSLHRHSLLSVLDSLAESIQICDVAGAVLHRTPALVDTLEYDPERARLEAALGTTVDALSRELSGRSGRVGTAARPVCETVETATARYAVRVCLYGAAPRGAAPLIVAALKRTTPVPRSEDELRRAYGLTPTEVRVAVLLARRMSNAEIAKSLIVSPHTARRHTEHVLRKLGVSSRMHVADHVLR